MKKINRDAYADMYGPTTGDKIRLADTELFIEVEKDLTTYGEEVKFGGGKTTYNYSFSKHANEFIPSVFKDWSNNNVLTNTLRIGVTDTKIHKNILKSTQTDIKTTKT